MAKVVSQTMASLSRRWLTYVEALGDDSSLLSEASAFQQAQQHVLPVRSVHTHQVVCGMAAVGHAC